MDAEIRLDRAHQAPGQFQLVGVLPQQAFFLRVRQTAELDEGRGDIRCGQHCEIGRALRMVEKRNLARELVDDFACEHNRQIAGLTAREVQQEGSNFARLLREVNAADIRRALTLYKIACLVHVAALALAAFIVI